MTLSGATTAPRVNLGEMAMKEYSAFPKAPVLLETHHQIVQCHNQDTRLGVPPLSKEAVGAFYRPSQLGNPTKKRMNDQELWNVHNFTGGCPRGVMVKAMDCGIVVSEFVLQSRNYAHFRANTLEKGMNPLILPAMG